MLERKTCFVLSSGGRRFFYSWLTVLVSLTAEYPEPSKLSCIHLSTINSRTIRLLIEFNSFCHISTVDISAGCRDLTEEIKNGVAIYTPGTVTFSIGERVSFRCDPNFKLDGKEVLTCDSGQRWTGDVPGCVPDGTVKSQGYGLISSLGLGFLVYLH